MKTIFETLVAAVSEAVETLSSGDASIVTVKSAGDYATADDLSIQDTLVSQVSAEHPDAVIFKEEEQTRTVMEANWAALPSLVMATRFLDFCFPLSQGQAS